ncbi:MAG: ATP-binding protein [Acidobacteriaceae bacterium]
MTRRPSSISAKLMLMNVVVSGTVLLLAVLAFFFYDLLSFRQNLILNLETAAQIVGTNSVSAMDFDDPESAATTMQALGNSPDVQAAALVTPAGTTFAEYRRPGKTMKLQLHALDANKIDDYWVSGQEVLIAHRIVFKGQSAGIVYIAAQLTETTRRARQYLTIAAIVLLICMAAGLLISATARRMLAQPMIALARTAQRVSRERDYSVRAEPHADNDEIAVLVNAFNEMLEQIQERDTALNRAREGLEVRVQERTAALRAANRELEAFSYTVAHDLRGPLDAVQGMVYILESLSEEGRAAERAEVLEQLRQSTRGMALLIDDLLNLARASTVALKKEHVNLSDLVRHIAEDLRRADPNRKVEFAIAQLPEIEADEGLMRVALDNLIRNAWKYTSRHDVACIEFGAARIHGEIAYFVRDDGAGFDPKLNEQLFQPFHRLHSRSEFPGTGIGLATVQRILARHGGRIWAEGAVEKGATFWFTLRDSQSAAA